jgi:hypothetical protein
MLLEPWDRPFVSEARPTAEVLLSLWRSKEHCGEHRVGNHSVAVEVENISTSDWR